MKIWKEILFFALFISSVQINAQSIVCYKYSDLEFGDVFIGYSENVPHNDTRSAKFYLYHKKFFRSDILVSFNLPKSLTNGVSNLPIKFNSSHASWSYRNNSYGRRNFDPNSPLEIRRLFFYFPIYIWLGGEIDANANLTPGNYSGTITITVEYL